MVSLLPTNERQYTLHRVVHCALVSTNSLANTHKKQATRETAGYLLFTLSIPATVLNVLVLEAARRLLRQYQESIHVFIFGMTIADLIITGTPERLRK